MGATGLTSIKNRFSGLHCLAPGNYVLLCNLGGGNNSHAGQGQRLAITVS
jgi:hypothetical protein